MSANMGNFPFQYQRKVGCKCFHYIVYYGKKKNFSNFENAKG